MKLIFFTLEKKQVYIPLMFQMKLKLILKLCSKNNKNEPPVLMLSKLLFHGMVVLMCHVSPTGTFSATKFTERI